MAGPLDTEDRTRQAAPQRGEFRELINVLEQQFEESDSSMFEVGEQRERNHRFYALQPIGNERPGRSQYISPDVLDVVESKKAYFSRTFMSARKTVKFSPTEKASQEEADKRTAYVNTQLGKNDWYSLLRDFWHDAFVAKRGTFLIEWLEDDEEYCQPVQNMPVAALMQEVEKDPLIIEIVDHEIDIQPSPQGPVANGKLTLLRDTSRVNITLMQPERVFRDPTKGYIKDCAYWGCEEDLTRSDFIQRGYDPDQVSNLNIEYRFRREEEDSQRKAHDRSWTRRRLHNRPHAISSLTLFKTWTWLDMSQYTDLVGDQASDMSDSANENCANSINEATLALYEIHWCRGEILMWADGTIAIREASEIPAFEWTELKVAHAEHGMAVADVLAHTQRSNSALKRLVIDNQQMRNTSRYEAVQNMVKNPRELLDNSIGGVVWTKKIGSVAPLATPELSPLTFQAIQMLDSDKEQRGGVSQLSQGLNPDAISAQNSERMIERLSNMGNERNARAARDFAETLLVPVSQYVYRLGVRNDENTYTVEASGKWQQIKPSVWEDTQWDMVVHVALTPEEAARHAQGLLMMHQVQSADPQLALMYGPEQKYALLDDVYDSMGIADSSAYLLRPDSPEYQKASQARQQQAQKAEQLQMAQMQFGMKMAETKEGREWYLAQLKGGELMAQTQNYAQDNEREDKKFAHSRIMDMAEYKLEKQQKRAVSL